MKILITGVTGFVGSWLAEYILTNHSEVEVCGIKRWRSPLDNISHIASKIKLYDCDLRDLVSLIFILQQVKPDKIFHLASQSYVPYSFTTPIETLNTNIIGTANLLEAIRICQLNPLIHVCSSSEVYGMVQVSDLPITEKQPFNPASPYAVSKVGEDMLALQYFTSYGMKTVRTRMFTHTGPRRGDVFASSNFAKQIALIEKGLQKPIVYVGNLDSVRTFCDVRDAVRAYWLLRDDMAGEVYNIGGLTTRTIGQMLETLVNLANMQNKVIVEIESSRMRPSDVTLQIPDSSKFQEATGWQPEIFFGQTMLDLLNYWRQRV